MVAAGRVTEVAEAGMEAREAEGTRRCSAVGGGGADADADSCARACASVLASVHALPVVPRGEQALGPIGCSVRLGKVGGVVRPLWLGGVQTEVAVMVAVETARAAVETARAAGEMAAEETVVETVDAVEETVEMTAGETASTLRK